MPFDTGWYAQSPFTLEDDLATGWPQDPCLNPLESKHSDNGNAEFDAPGAQKSWNIFFRMLRRRTPVLSVGVRRSRR